MPRARAPADLLPELQRLAREQLGRQVPLATDQRLVEDLGLDSIGLLTLAVAVEDHFRITLDEQDEAELRTVGDLLALVAGKLA